MVLRSVRLIIGFACKSLRKVKTAAVRSQSGKGSCEIWWGKKYQVSQNGMTQGDVVRQLHLFPMLQNFSLRVFNGLRIKWNKASDWAQINIVGDLLNRNRRFQFLLLPLSMTKLLLSWQHKQPVAQEWITSWQKQEIKESVVDISVQQWLKNLWLIENLCAWTVSGLWASI